MARRRVQNDRWGVWLLAAGLLGVPAPAGATDTEMPPPDEVAAQAEEGGVSRAQFTTSVLNREPTDSVSAIGTEATRVHFFTELSGMEGHTVVHRWERNGEVIAEVPFEVRGPRWRVYSTKSLLPGAGGDWMVSVVDSSGKLLESSTLKITEQGPMLARPESIPQKEEKNAQKAEMQQNQQTEEPSHYPAAPED